jgi:hypothetical protein
MGWKDIYHSWKQKRECIDVQLNEVAIQDLVPLNEMENMNNYSFLV